MISRGTLRDYALPALTAVFVFTAFSFGVFFSGFDKPWFAPSVLLMSAVGGILLFPGLKSGWRFPSAPVALLLVAFWVWLWVSSLWSQVPHVSTVFCMTIGVFPLLFIGLVQHERAADFINAGRMALIAVMALLSLWALFQFTFLHDLVGERIHHPMLNANNLAVALMMGVFLLVPYFAKAQGWAKVVWGGLILLSVFAIVTTQSRGGMLATIVCGAVFVFTCRDVVKRDWKAYAVLLGSAAVMMVACLMIMDARMPSMHLLGGGDAPASNEIRTLLWRSGFHMLMDHPFGRGGLGTFYLMFPPYRYSGDYSDGFFLHVDPFQFGIETGFMATVLFYAFAVAVLVRTVRAIQAAKGNAGSSAEMMAGFCGLLGLLFNAHLNFDLYMITTTMVTPFLLAAWYRGSEEMLGAPQRVAMSLRDRRHAMVLVPALLVVFVAGPIWILRMGYAVQVTGQAMNAMAAGDLERGAALSAKVQRYGPPSYDRGYYAESVWRAQILQKQFLSLDPEDRERLYDEAMAAIDKAIAVNPYNIQMLNHRAMLYMLSYPRINSNGLDLAIETLQQAMAMDPVNLELRMSVARLYDTKKRYNEAVTTLADGLKYELAQRYAPPQYFVALSNARAKIGDNAGAAQAMGEAQERDKQMRISLPQRFRLEAWVNQKTQWLLDR